MNKTITAAIFALAATVAFAQAEKPPKPSKQVIASVGHIKGLLVADFKDPEASKFRNVRAFAIEGTDDPRAISVCGEVNAKNSYGAYVGYKVFVSMAGYAQIEGAIPGDLLKDTVAKACTGKLLYVGPEK